MNIVEIESIIRKINSLIWGFPLIGAILGIGTYLMLRLNILKISNFKRGIKYVFDENKTDEHIGDISNFASLCTVLSATLGTGNIVGVAVAITIGGPGVLFWLWISAILCFSIKYSEGLLAIKYRIIGTDGKISGGPMYYIEKGLKNKKLAKIYAFCGMLVSLFGIGTLAQSNSIIAAANSFGIPITISVIVLGIAVIAITIGGINRISKVSEKIVPIMTFAYIGAAIWVLIMKMNLIPGAFYMILKGAFVPEAILGAGAGATIMTAVHLGISRGIFSHESGLGSAAVASATAKTDSCVKQGLISMIGAFLTVVVCTVTGLVIIVTSTDTSIFTAARTLEGSELTAYSFGIGIGMLELGKCIVNLGIIFFAFTTIIGWNYYGEKFAQYLMGNKMVIPFKILFVFLVILGPFLKIDMTFIIADIVIGLMAIPNIIGIIGLRKEIIEETNKFFRRTMG